MLQTSVPLFAKYYLDASELVVSYITVASYVASFFAVLYMGLVLRRVKRTITFGLGLMSATIPLFALTKNVFTLVAVVTAINVGAGPIQPLLLTSAVLLSDERTRFRNIALYTSALSLSLILGPLYQASMLFVTRDNLLISMLAFTPFVVLGFLLFREVKLAESVTSGALPDMRFLKNRNFLIGIVANETYSIPFVALTTFGGITAKSVFGASYTQVEALFSCFFVTSFFTRIVISRIKIQREHLVTSSIALTLVGLFAIYLSQNLYELAAAFVLLGYPHGATYPVSASYIADSATKESLASANALSSFLFGVTTVLSVPLVGLAEEFLGLKQGFLLLEAPVVAMGITFFVLKRMM
jgi:Major Facilitator Superfamily.